MSSAVAQQELKPPNLRPHSCPPQLMEIEEMGKKKNKLKKKKAMEEAKKKEDEEKARIAKEKEERKRAEEEAEIRRLQKAKEVAEQIEEAKRQKRIADEAEKVKSGSLLSNPHSVATQEASRDRIKSDALRRLAEVRVGR